MLEPATLHSCLGKTDAIPSETLGNASLWSHFTHLPLGYFGAVRLNFQLRLVSNHDHTDPQTGAPAHKFWAQG
jgi:hypothetical protein